MDVLYLKQCAKGRDAYLSVSFSSAAARVKEEEWRPESDIAAISSWILLLVSVISSPVGWPAARSSSIASTRFYREPDRLVGERGSTVCDANTRG